MTIDLKPIGYSLRRLPHADIQIRVAQAIALNRIRQHRWFCFFLPAG